MAIIFLYTAPILLYCIIYKNCKVLIEILCGSVAFLYYSPAYLIVLNIYALCRINDISWGTKGLDATQTSGNQDVEDTWKAIRTIHVAKYLFWNIVWGIILLTLGGEYETRFYITFIIVIILASTLFFKVFVAMLYLIKMGCCSTIPTPGKKSPDRLPSQVFDYFYAAKSEI